MTLASWKLQVKLSVPKKCYPAGNQELETVRCNPHYVDYFSFLLVLGLSLSGKDHTLKYTKQHVLLLLFILDWQMWTLLLPTH